MLIQDYPVKWAPNQKTEKQRKSTKTDEYYSVKSFYFVDFSI